MKSSLEDVKDSLAKECPLGLLMADVLRMLSCFEGREACAETFEVLVREALGVFGLRVLMGTAWPLLGALKT